MDYKKYTLLNSDAPAEEYPLATYSLLGPDVCQECGAPDSGMVAVYDPVTGKCSEEPVCDVEAKQ